MIRSADVLDQHVAERVAKLRVRTRRAVEGLRSGVHRSPHRGASVIFAEHRDYRPGDDLRLLDWRVYARSDKDTIKRFEQETHMRAHLLLDTSASMAYDGGDADTEKCAYGASLLSALGFLLLGQGDAVSAHTMTAGLGHGVPCRSRPDHLEALVSVLGVGPSAGATTNLRTSLTGLAEQIGRRGFVAIASDLLDFDGSALEPLSFLHARGHEVLVFHIVHPHEEALPFDERFRFEDLESGEVLDVDAVAMRASYKKQFAAFRDSCRQRCINAGARYIVARTDTPIQQVLAEILGGRKASGWG